MNFDSWSHHSRWQAHTLWTVPVWDGVHLVAFSEGFAKIAMCDYARLCVVVACGLLNTVKSCDFSVKLRSDGFNKGFDSFGGILIFSLKILTMQWKENSVLTVKAIPTPCFTTYT